MAISSGVLRDHIKQRDLVSIRRAKIDSHSMQGFLLACSDALLLLQYVHDFHLDGYLLLRRADISEITSSKTDVFQRGLLQKEGVLDQVDFGFRRPLQSFDSFLASCPADEIVIVEDESENAQDFLIGTVNHVHDGIAHVNHFTGIARLQDDPVEISTTRITCCQIQTHYIEFYQRHFERTRLLKK